MAMLLLWILSLAASFLPSATGEVGKSFDSCSQFFLSGNPPNLVPQNPARICQYYKGSYRFATMYDRDGRIPWFSAYKYNDTPDALQDDWKIEPQLALPGARQRISMEPEQTCQINPRQLANSQAVLEDYDHVFQYNKGQLVPASHQQKYDSQAATYTLTNVVPQYQELMNGEWENFLRSMSKTTAGCSETYVIVGVVPGDDPISAGRVKKPSHIWAAVCCLSVWGKKESWGVIAENNQNTVERLCLKELERKLQDKYKKVEINLFNGKCY